jgi:hypothetical protein
MTNPPQGCVPDSNPGKKYLSATTYSACLSTASTAPTGVYASTWRSTSFTYSYGNWTDHPSNTSATHKMSLAALIGIVVAAIVLLACCTL